MMDLGLKVFQKQKRKFFVEAVGSTNLEGYLFMCPTIIGTTIAIGAAYTLRHTIINIFGYA